MILWITGTALVLLSLCSKDTSGLQTSSCSFNSMCQCSPDQHDLDSRTISSITCLSVPFYKLPNLPEGGISQLEVVGSMMAAVESESLDGSQVHSLTLSNNRLQHVAERAFSSMSKTLSSLDLSYNQLDSVPFQAMKDLRNLQWLNLHGNEIHSIVGDWSHMKTNIVNLFLGENDIAEVPSEGGGEHSGKLHHGLRQFKSLIWLNLDGNRISRVHRHSLPMSLQTVSLSHNLIESFPIDVISTSPHLQWLYLRGNHIRSFPAEHTFPRKLWLEKIDLGENYLRTLPKLPFNNSVYIRDLNLAFNDIRTISSDSFNGLQCGRIIVSHNQLENVEPKAFNGIETTLEYLDFDHNNFIHVPHALSQLKSLKYLYLSSNSLTEIPPTIFESFCESLKAVSFSGNNLNKIPKEALVNCTKISHFNIAYNEIYEISEDDFTDWGYNIKSLIMGNNHITSLKPQIFAELSELRELSLSFNPLRYIDPEAFIGLDYLESLEMSFGIEIGELPYEIFKPIPNLQWLSIDNNNFFSLPEEAFDYLPELKYINLESNKLNGIHVNLLKSKIHTKLRDARFSNNEIGLIGSHTFHGLASLETVLLATNRIKGIARNGFSDLPNLQKLILSDNQISSISVHAFTNLPNLGKLDLQNNQLVEFSFKIFANISNPLHLNLSRNQIMRCDADNKILNIEILDLRYNSIDAIPKCFENISMLRKLYLDFNTITVLEQNTFMHLTSLEQLTLQQNDIRNINRRAFSGLQNLQTLDLSSNRITQLHNLLFSKMPRLRILNLSNNNINYLSKEIFSNTVLEMLDLSSNSFAVIPSLSLSEVGLTLRHLNIRFNNIEHIDSTTFPDIPYLQFLDLGNNKLTILPDNVFTSLGMLQKLDLSYNNIRANYKELFHYAQNLKELRLSHCGITTTPSLPLPNLVYLNLSNNNIDNMNRNTVQDLLRLKHLDLSNNKVVQIPSHLWNHLPHLKSLDLSNNPIKELVAETFQGLKNLQILNIQGLSKLQKFDAKALTHIKILHTLALQTWPKIENFKAQLCALLANANQIRILKLHVEDPILDDQLICISNRKIRQLEITGKNLKSVDRDAFQKFSKNPDLVLKITGTEIEELPAGLFANMYKISYLNIDLRNNMLSYLSPEIFYGNVTTWKNAGTTLISGGLTISHNPFKCGCHLAWLGHWLRRWMRESLQSHDAPVETSMRMNDLVKEATCTDSTKGVTIPIVQLPPEDMSCHASALSTAPNSNNISVIYIVCFLIFNFISR
ncbi:PREDICTED: slit homolog 1 protein [Nicrophorus vespilloides]|uniref:Slit homolog 1 protein n=1 Tax=Nicrophorus vespilloides TaxID=110193 RepID=A0ABM1M954_NICVS|nr:PREDICTED: slit homolog 1 protein [Nicrophorus vespilloides]